MAELVLYHVVDAVVELLTDVVVVVHCIVTELVLDDVEVHTVVQLQTDEFVAVFCVVPSLYLIMCW